MCRTEQAEKRRLLSLLALRETIFSGEGGIRTPVTLIRRKTDFESVPFNHSGTSPFYRVVKIRIYYPSVASLLLFAPSRENKMQLPEIVSRAVHYSN